MTAPDPVRPSTSRLAVRPARAADLAAIARIYNEGIRDRVATFETRERTPEELRPWLDDPGHPLLVAVGTDDTSAGAGSADDERRLDDAASLTPVDTEGAVLGWAAASSYRPRPCYAGIGEFSIYVAREARGLGVGHALMRAFLPACVEAGLWKVLSRVFPENAGSRALLAAHGFREVGVYERHARLDGVWRDVVIVEKLLGEADEGAGADAAGG